MSARDEIRKRIENQNAASAGQVPAAQSVAPPAPAPEAVPQAGQPQVDPAIQATLDQEKAARAEAERERAQLVEQNKQLQERMATLEAQAQQQMQLPSTQDLDGMPQGEAITKGMGAMKAYLDSAVRSLASQVNRDAIEPVREGLAKLTLGQKLEEARAFGSPNLVNKYKGDLEANAARYPDLSGTQLLKMVASPGELSSQAAPTTPAPEAPAAAYMEGGHSAHASQPSPAQQQAQQPTSKEKLAQVQELRQQGRDADANALRREVIKDRLTANATHRAGAGG